MNKDIKTFIKIYNESCKQDIVEKTLENSTELTDENTENIQTESFGKWVKNLVTKGKGGQNKELKNTILGVLKKYNFQQAEDNQGNLNRYVYQKGQNKYDIIVHIDKQLFSKDDPSNTCDLHIKVKNGKTKKVLGKEIVTVKHSWTSEELEKALNHKLSDICDIELSESYNPIQSKNKNDNLQQNKQKSNSINLAQIKNVSGLDRDGIYDVGMNELQGDKQQFKTQLHYLFSGFAKLTPEEINFIKNEYS